MPDPPPTSQLITPDLRRRLSQRLEEATRLAASEPCDHARVHELLAECLQTDPGNILYVSALLANLRRWGPRPKRSWLPRWLGGNSEPPRKQPDSGAGPVLSTQYLVPSTQVDDATKLLQQAPKLLRAHHLDPVTLRQLATACGTLEFDEAELRYLQAALDCQPDDLSTLRQLGIALLRQGRFDDTLPIWRQVAEKLPNDAFAQQALADLTAYSPLDETTTKGLRNQIAANPTAFESYLPLAEILIATGRIDEAESALADAQAACGGDLRIREAREQLQLARSTQRLEIARRRAASDSHPRAQQLVARLEQEHNRLEIDILSLRSERLPEDSRLRLELARRLKQAGNFSGAVQRLEEARREPTLGGEVLLELGECWQHLRQFAKALEYYRQAVDAQQSRDQGSRSEKDSESTESAVLPRSGGPHSAAALYRLGVLAAALNDPAQARSALERLVAIDPGYKDARQRLDKLP